MTEKERKQERKELFKRMQRSCGELHQYVALLREMDLQHLHLQEFGRSLMVSNCDAVVSILCEMDEIEKQLAGLYE